MRRLFLRVITAVQLTRLTMAFGAVSDLWFMILLTRASYRSDAAREMLEMHLGLALLAGAVVAVGLFAYGASLNDVLDVRHDSAFSPDRPIPAGRIRVGQAIVVAVGALLVAILGGLWLGTSSLSLTLLVAMGILFYNAAGKYIPAISFVTIGLIHAVHMLIPNAGLTFTLPIWLVMTHSMVIAIGAHALESKRPRMTRVALIWTGVGWAFWSGVLLWWSIDRGEFWPVGSGWEQAVWPLMAVVGFAAVAMWKTSRVTGATAAEKLRRYGAMWQSLYGASWLLVVGLYQEALWIGLFALAGFAGMTLIKESMGLVNRPLTYRA